MMMLRILVMARLLDVQAFSDFSAGILMSSTFCMLGCLGLQAMLQREWPMNLVRGQELRALVRAAQCGIVATACCLAGLAAAALGLSIAGMAPALLAVGLLHGLSQQCFLVATIESRSRGDALRFANQNLLRAVIAMALSLAVALQTGSALQALLADALATMAMSLGFFRRSLGHAGVKAAKVAILATRRLARVNWRSALTLMLTMVVGFGMLNADRWVASDRLGATGFAHYSFAWIVLSIAQSIHVVVNASVYPLVARRFAEHGRQVAFGVCLRVSLAILVASGIAAVPLGCALAYGVERWYPQFIDAIALLPLFLAIAVLRVSDFWSSFLLISGFEGRLLRINVAAAVVGVMGWSVAVRPWAAPGVSPSDVGWLAALLTLSAYAATVIVSWRARQA
ncbi:lipopolysaccharide biosynthesis protein [Sphaerotilaceae bacterium SBD11-9]